MKMQLPMYNPEKYPITQMFGEKFMYQGKMCDHKGLDFAMPKYTQLIAPFDGEVVRVENTRDYG